MCHLCFKTRGFLLLLLLLLLFKTFLNHSFKLGATTDRIKYIFLASMKQNLVRKVRTSTINYNLKLVRFKSPVCMGAKSLQSCPTLCDPMNCNLPGSSVHGILQARTLEWVAMPFLRRSSKPGSKALSQASLALATRFVTTAPTGKPLNVLGEVKILKGLRRDKSRQRMIRTDGSCGTPSLC